jgi:hypothetical protein
MTAKDTVKRVARRPVGVVRRLVRRAFAPKLTHLTADRDRLFHELGLAFESVTAAHKGIADLQQEARSLRQRLDMTLLLAEANQARIQEYENGLLEARRLSLRVAELTDVVTEVVLPLHDRNIDR